MVTLRTLEVFFLAISAAIYLTRQFHFFPRLYGYVLWLITIYIAKTGILLFFAICAIN